MTGNSKARAGKVPKTPYLALKTLEPLVGRWKLTGEDVDGEFQFEWMEGGFKTRKVPDQGFKIF